MSPRAMKLAADPVREAPAAMRDFLHAAAGLLAAAGGQQLEPQVTRAARRLAAKLRGEARHDTPLASLEIDLAAALLDAAGGRRP